MSPTLTVANWKMNGNRRFWSDLTQSLKGEMQDIETNVVLCAPSAAFYDVSRALEGVTNMALAAQDIHAEDSGAHTGDTSAEMAKDFGAKFTLVGHSERRIEHFEKGDVLKAKFKQALNHDLHPILCFGESLEDKKNDQTLTVLDAQLSEVLDSVEVLDGDAFSLAYEPVWAISSSAGSLGREPSEDELTQVFEFVRQKMMEKFGEKVGNNIKLLYGGSVKADNVAKIISNRYIAGVLVGGASLKAESFLAIARAVAAKPN